MIKTSNLLAIQFYINQSILFMKLNLTTTILSLVFLLPSFSFAQQKMNHPTEIGMGVYWGKTAPLKNLATISQEEFEAKLNKRYVPNEEDRKAKLYPFTEMALPKGNDPVWQISSGNIKSKNSSILENFSGQNSPYSVSDCNGSVGPDHFVNTVNSSIAIYDKVGTLVSGPTALNLLFGDVPGTNCNDGDPIVLYDEQADRWIVAEFSVCQNPNRMLIAVSTSNDPTGSWHQYSFIVTTMPDYEKFGVWQDAYYMGTNTDSGTDIYAFERDQMLVGGNAQMIGFDNAWKPNLGGVTVPPVDNDGAFAPDGSPGLFIAANDDAWGGSPDQLWIWEFVTDWSDPSNSTFDRVQQLDVSPFDSNFGPSWENIVQPETSQKLDGLIGYMMNRPQYRNFGSYETILCTHTVDVDQTDHAGVRWYELRRENGGEWTVRQEGTYAPDEHSRWMASIALNGNNEIGIGYSISSTTEYPGLRICGQSLEQYEFASGIFDIEEEIVHQGTHSQTGGNRWGDYFNTSVDPINDHTFWFSGEYKQGSGKKTKICSFQFEPLPITAAFNVDESIICNGSSVVFEDQSYGFPVSWEWTFEGGIPESYTGQTPPPITYNTNGIFNVSLTVSDGTEEHTLLSEGLITVKDVISDFSSDITTVVVEQGVIFTDESKCDVISWEWTFEGGTPESYNGQNPPTIYYNELGSYDVSLLVTNAISSEEMIKVAYIDVIECNLCESVYNDTNYDWISNVTLNTIDNTSGSVGYEDYTYISTDLELGSTHDISVTIDVNGNYSQYAKVWIDWNQNCNFEFDEEAYELGVVQGTGTLTEAISVPVNAVLGTTIMRVSEQWEEIPTNCGGGEYGETEDYSLNVVAGDVPPIACFSATPVWGDAPLMVNFTDCSVNLPTSWLWDFGDGNTSTEQNPSNVYSLGGVYTVSLTVTNEFGENALVKEDYIDALNTGVIINGDEVSIQVLPNPVSDKLYISHADDMVAYLYNTAGQLVLKSERLFEDASLDLSAYESGAYVIKIIGDNTTYIKHINIVR